MRVYVFNTYEFNKRVLQIHLNNSIACLLSAISDYWFIMIYALQKILKVKSYKKKKIPALCSKTQNLDYKYNI